MPRQMQVHNNPHWCVVRSNGDGPADVWYSFEDGKPFDRKTAEKVAANNNMFIQTSGTAVARPLTRTTKPSYLNL